MLTDRLQAVVERAAALPAEHQNAIAEALNSLLAEYAEPWPTAAPPLPPNLEAIVEQGMRDHADMLEYLEDK
jgi:hypothetical protein